MKDAALPKVVPFRPRRSDLEQIVRSLAEDDRKVFFGPHARERMTARGITRLDALKVLRRGHIEGDIEPGANPGEIKIKMVATIKGSREIGVISVVINGTKVFVKTVEWEDL